MPFDHATLVKLYGTKAAYLAKFTAATDTAIANGYILPADRAAILGAMPPRSTSDQATRRIVTRTSLERDGGPL